MAVSTVLVATATADNAMNSLRSTFATSAYDITSTSQATSSTTVSSTPTLSTSTPGLTTPPLENIIIAVIASGIPSIAMVIATIIVAIGVITWKKRRMYDLTVQRRKSEIEMQAFTNAMYGKMEGTTNSKAAIASVHFETEINESKFSDYATPNEIRGTAGLPKSTPISIPASSKKLSSQYSELEEAVRKAPICLDDQNYTEVHQPMGSVRSPSHQPMGSVRSPGHQPMGSVRSPGHQPTGSVRSPGHQPVSNTKHQSSHVGSPDLQAATDMSSDKMGVLGPQETEYLEPPPDETQLYAQFTSMHLEVLARDTVQVVSHLGSGHFGTVDKGVWQSCNGPKEVAIKTLNPGMAGDDRVKFLQEAAIMGQFSHPNVVKLYGIITDGEPKMMVLELLNKGDLKQYIATLRPSSTDDLSSHLPSKLITACGQIASGMCYLANKGFVHRDLAARNILVSADDQCKIADFGMSRDLANENYYISHGGKIPVKWTAPEAIYYKKYSTASDVWSFGCVMYEIWSLGCKPFETYSTSDTMRLVDSGYRLPPPPGCPRGVYELMIQCWNSSSANRPAFITLCRSLTLTKDLLLSWSSVDRDTYPQATLLGAPLEFGQDLYLDLQRKYCHFRNSFV